MAEAELALIITAIGTITTPIVVGYFAREARKDLMRESNKNLQASADVKKEVVTGNELTMGQLEMRKETRRVEDIAEGDRSPQEQRHVDADPMHKETP